MSGLPKSGHDWAIYEYTPELDAARRSRAAQPGRLHCTACTPPALLRLVTMPRSPRACSSACSSTWALAAASSTALACLAPRASCSRRNCCARWRRSVDFAGFDVARVAALMKDRHPAGKSVGSCGFAFLEPGHDVFVDLWRELLEIEQHEHGRAYASDLVDQRALDVPEHDHRFRLR